MGITCGGCTGQGVMWLPIKNRVGGDPWGPIVSQHITIFNIVVYVVVRSTLMEIIPPVSPLGSHPLRLPAASTISSPPPLINSLSLPTSPPSLASTSSSVSEFSSASDLPLQTPPLAAVKYLP